MSHDIPTGRIGTCEHCGKAIAEIRDPHSNARDWYSHGGDFGCDMSPDCTDEAVGGHEPRLTRDMYCEQPVRARPPTPTLGALDPADPFSLPEGI